MSRTRYLWWGYAKNMLRHYPDVTDRERAAVEAALSEIRALPDGQSRVRLVELIYFRRVNTLEGAAMALHCSARTARRWHADFVVRVGRNFGLLGESWP